MRRLIWLPLAGFLLIAGAAAAFAAPQLVATATDTLGAPLTRAGSVLQAVLADLVEDGVINQGQSDAIVEAVDARHVELRAEMEARREEMQRLRQQIATFLEDGVITADEIAQLPEDHPLRNLDSYLEDGQLTLEELRQLGGWGGRGGFGGHGRHGGPGWFAPSEEDSD
jgi:polyhydroxyalkanoate synthesis regulator phasin